MDPTSVRARCESLAERRADALLSGLSDEEVADQFADEDTELADKLVEQLHATRDEMLAEHRELRKGFEERLQSH